MSDSALFSSHVKFKRRSKKEINELVALAQSGSREATHTLVLQYTNFIHKEAKRYVSETNNLDDLYQAGVEGFLKSLRNYDPAYGVALLTHSARWIFNELMKLTRDQYSLVRFATTRDKYKAIISLRKVMRTGKTIEEAAAYLAIPLEIAKEALQYLNAGPAVSLDQPVRMADQAGSATARTTLMDQLVSPDASADDIVDEKKRVKMLRRAMFTLSPIEQDIVTRTFLKPEKEIAQDIAPDYGISRERVRQIKEEAVDKIRRYFRRHGMKE